MLTIAVIEDNAGKVVEAKVFVDGCLGLQVVLVLAMVLVQLVQHRLVCALKTYIGQLQCLALVRTQFAQPKSNSLIVLTHICTFGHP